MGRQIKWGGDTSPAPWMTIVGVVGNVKQATLDRPTIAQAYEPFSQLPDPIAANTIIGLFRTVNLVVRSDREPDALVAASARKSSAWIRRCRSRTRRRSTDLVGESVKPQRFSMTVVGLFAIVALGLAGDRHLRRPGERREPADARNRRPHGARRARVGGDVVGAAPRAGVDGDWRRDRDRRGAGADARDGGPALRSPPDRRRRRSLVRRCCSRCWRSRPA